MPLFQNESTYKTFENEYDSHESEPAGGEHFHVNAFAGGHRQLRNAFLCVDLAFGRAITSCLCTTCVRYIFTYRPTGAENLDRMGVLCKQTASKKNECPWLLERTGKSTAEV